MRFMASLSVRSLRIGDHYEELHGCVTRLSTSLRDAAPSIMPARLAHAFLTMRAPLHRAEARELRSMGGCGKRD
jgi:hypothetical protein